MNQLPFPKIDPKVFDREGLKECYVFKPKKEERNCPTVIHFVLVNIEFRTFKAPGVCIHLFVFVSVYIGNFFNEKSALQIADLLNSDKSRDLDLSSAPLSVYTVL